MGMLSLSYISSVRIYLSTYMEYNILPRILICVRTRSSQHTFGKTVFILPIFLGYISLLFIENMKNKQRLRK